jgi:DNA invertase Pin-like site-specific DNA recombinase
MRNTQNNFGGRLRPKEEEPTSWENLVDLPNERMAFVYKRLSSHEQVKKSIYSIKAQDALKDLALEDGYLEKMVHIEERDLGISGTKGREERPGLAFLIDQVELGLVESVYVVHMSRLYRDQTLINAFALGELFKKHGVIIVTPQMRLNLHDRMHMRMYRIEVERAADELELMAHRLLGAQELKAKSGLYAGEALPAGYVVDEQNELPNGDPNPKYHTYRVFEPHAEVVRTIFEQLAMPGMTPTRVLRYCRDRGIVLVPFPPDLDTPANRKSFATSRRDADGSWSFTMERVRNIATNPAYIGWKFWAGEIVSKDVYPPIVEEDIFWSVQEKFTYETRPKKQHDPLPLAGLLYCADHETPQRMSYVHKTADRAYYQCSDSASGEACQYITAHHLDKPVSEAFIEMVTLPEVADDVLNEMTDEYEQAKAQAARYRREKKRLENEVESLRGNLLTGVMGPDQLKWIDDQIQQRLARINELAQIESQPIGAAVGRPLPGREDIELVRELLHNLGSTWDEKSNGLKNTLLRLLLEQVIIWPKPATVRVKLVWRFGPPRELMIYRPYKKTNRNWTEEEVEILEKHYETASQSDLMSLLPNRSWKSIAGKGKALGLSRAAKLGKRVTRKPRAYTSEEDDLIRRYYNGEITRDELQAATNRTVTAINHRANRLGLKFKTRHVSWEWLPVSEEQESPGHAWSGCGTIPRHAPVQSRARCSSGPRARDPRGAFYSAFNNPVISLNRSTSASISSTCAWMSRQ